MFDAILLGITQGLTEFLPVSSSAHLLLLEKALNFDQDSHSFTIAIHLATTIAVIIYFWKDLLQITKAFFSAKTLKEQESRSIGLKIILATLPSLLIGYFIQKTEWYEHITSNVVVIGISLIVFGLILYFADKLSFRKEKEGDQKKLTIADSIIIGLSQLIAAIFPGASRSGITLTTSFFRNIERKEAARFIFLISIPMSGLPALYEIFMGDNLILNNQFFVAFIAAFVSGLAAIHFLLEIVRKYSLKWFCLYRVLLGLGVLAFALI